MTSRSLKKARPIQAARFLRLQLLRPTLGEVIRSFYSMTRNHLHLFSSVLCFFCFSQAYAEDSLKYRQADYEFEVVPGETGTKMHWSYPVFLGGTPQATNTLNAWIRDQSLEVLTECAEMSLSELRVLKDSQVQIALARSKKFAECEMTQSVVRPAQAFASYLSFEHYTEWMGQARPQHGITTLTFSLARKQKFEMKAFFKPDAIESLNELLAKKISLERPNCKRSFGWTQVTLSPPDTLLISFPYDPSEWAECGDGVEMIEGARVKRLLVSSSSLRPKKKLLEVK